MHPDITKTIAALRVDEKHSAAAAARLVRQARQARAGRAAGSLPLPGSAATPAGGRPPAADTGTLGSRPTAAGSSRPGRPPNRTKPRRWHPSTRSPRTAPSRCGRSRSDAGHDPGPHLQANQERAF